MRTRRGLFPSFPTSKACKEACKGWWWEEQSTSVSLPTRKAVGSKNVLVAHSSSPCLPVFADGLLADCCCLYHLKFSSLDPSLPLLMEGSYEFYLVQENLKHLYLWDFGAMHVLECYRARLFLLEYLSFIREDVKPSKSSWSNSWFLSWEGISNCTYFECVISSIWLES